MTDLTEVAQTQQNVPSVNGIISSNEVAQTAETIIENQLASGMITWFINGHADTWNHVEATMALTVAGRTVEASKGMQWLASSQRHDGSWHNYYLENGIEDEKLDTNCICYVATGVWHYFLATGDAGFLETMWPTVSKAVDFVLELQTDRGEVLWARKSDSKPWNYALLTGSSSIYHSLGCALAIADHLGHEKPNWADSRARLGSTIRNCPEAFEPKDRWALDWFYPVLSGALDVDDARSRMLAGFETFVVEGEGVRCVSDKDWVTAAETCEAVIALVSAGLRAEATRLFKWAQQLRNSDGAYFTGRTVPDHVLFPAGETSTYTAAAAILAADTLCGQSSTSDLFCQDQAPKRS